MLNDSIDWLLFSSLVSRSLWSLLDSVSFESPEDLSAVDTISPKPIEYVANLPGKEDRSISSTASPLRSEVSILYRRFAGTSPTVTELTATSGKVETASRTDEISSPWPSLNATCTLVPPVKSISKMPCPRCQAATRPIVMKTSDRMTAGRTHRTNSYFVFPNKRAIESVLRSRFCSARSKITREQNTAVNKLRDRPRIRVTAKPLS